MRPWILIDISYLAHRARYATADLQWEDFHTGVLFGFWEQLRHICSDRNIQSNRVVFCFDSRQSYRKKTFPEYKAHRRTDLTDEEKVQIEAMYDQVKLLRADVLPAVGFQVVRQTGCESDDVMAQIARQLTAESQPGIMVTADGDLWQCISHSVHWYDPARERLYTPSVFANKKGIACNMWGQVKAIAGCSGDGVPGVPRVGEKTAVRYLTSQLPSHHKTYQAIISPEGKRIIERNKPLVILPHTKTKPIELREPDYSIEGFFDFCERYGFRTYLKDPKKSEWEAFLSNKHTHTRRRGEHR
jgi:5'-3' exonuclease